MSKEESLAFLQSCIDKIENASKEEIAFYKEILEKKYKNHVEDSEFEFVPPLDSMEYKYEFNTEFELDALNQDDKRSVSQSDYSFSDSELINQDSSADLPFAA